MGGFLISAIHENSAIPSASKMSKPKIMIKATDNVDICGPVLLSMPAVAENCHRPIV
jgi:hypothetical protein